MREAIVGCGGSTLLGGLGPSDRVVIKPNLVGWDRPYPVAPYGVYTTTRIVEDLVILLRDAGARRIAVAEGSVRFTPDDPGTRGLFELLGYDRLAERYGLRLVDLLHGPFEKRTIGDVRIGFAAAALEADVLINLPVLKTHNQTMLSAGLKNLKGCIDERSRRLFHGKGRHAHSLDFLISGLVEHLRPALTIVDGIYGLERGPFALGRARRMDSLAASTDPLAADIAAAALVGLDPAEVAHLAECARRSGVEPALSSVELRGEPLQALSRDLEWDFEWETEPSRAGPPLWRRMGVEGLSMPRYDASLCTGCSAIYNPLVVLLTSAHRSESFGGLQVLTGKRMRPAEGFARSMLVGDCMIGRNRKDPRLAEAIEVPGCPPSIGELVEALQGIGLAPDPGAVMDFRMRQARRYAADPDFDPAHFSVLPDRRDWPGPARDGGT